MGFFSSSDDRGDGDVTARQAQSIMCEWMRRNAEKIASDVRSGGARAVREIADHLEAGTIRSAR